MGIFIRVTLVVAAIIVGLAALVFVLKLLVVAAVIAALAIGLAFVVRLLRGRPRRLDTNRQGWVTALTARR